MNMPIQWADLAMMKRYWIFDREQNQRQMRRRKADINKAIDNYNTKKINLYINYKSSSIV